ncbi:hypothetical protein B0H19DRAFT_196315 [Mycena capillaripes]|nr:hypothetical protein B0H19DRAFT_196315 [Mycena capillaripes]
MVCMYVESGERGRSGKYVDGRRREEAVGRGEVVSKARLVPHPTHTLKAHIHRAGGVRLVGTDARRRRIQASLCSLGAAHLHSPAVACAARYTAQTVSKSSMQGEERRKREREKSAGLRTRTQNAYVAHGDGFGARARDVFGERGRNAGRLEEKARRRLVATAERYAVCGARSGFKLRFSLVETPERSTRASDSKTCTTTSDASKQTHQSLRVEEGAKARTQDRIQSGAGHGGARSGETCETRGVGEMTCRRSTIQSRLLIIA